MKYLPSGSHMIWLVSIIYIIRSIDIRVFYNTISQSAEYQSNGLVMKNIKMKNYKTVNKPGFLIAQPWISATRFLVKILQVVLL
jgi:hypothetical protein